jgi:hypothetical protein
MLKGSMTLAMLWTNFAGRKRKVAEGARIVVATIERLSVYLKSRIPSDKHRQVSHESLGKSPSLIPSRTTYIQFYCI